MRDIIFEKVKEVIEDMDINGKAFVYGQYCYVVNYYDDVPINIDDIDELFHGCTPTEILKKLDGLDLKWNYFVFDGYGYVREWDEIDDIDELIDYILENEECFGNYDIAQVLEEVVK